MTEIAFVSTILFALIYSAARYVEHKVVQGNLAVAIVGVSAFVAFWVGFLTTILLAITG